MSTHRTISSSHFTRSYKESTSYNPYKSYKEFTFGNKQLPTNRYPSNILEKHYSGFPKKSNLNRSGWLDKRELETKECKELDGKTFRRKFKPDSVSFVIEMDSQIDFQKNKQKSRNFSSTSKQNSSNSFRTVLPDNDVNLPV